MTITRWRMGGRWGSLKSSAARVAKRGVSGGRGLLGWCTEGPRRAWRWIKQVNWLSSAGPVNGKHEAALLTLLPLVTFAVVYVATNIESVAYRPGCNSASNFLATLIFRPAKPSTCTAATFLSDIPTVILSITCPVALVSYRLLWRRISSLPAALGETGLLERANLTPSLSRAIDQLRFKVDLNWLWRLGIFTLSLGMTTWLYTRNLADGHLFSILSSGNSDPRITAALRDSWWANYHHHPVLALLCISIGSTGVYYALRAGWLYLRLGAVLIMARSSAIDVLNLRYVPRWRDASYGWSPVTGILFLIYLSAVGFTASMVAVFDMLQNKAWTLYVAVSFGLLGIVATLLIVGGSLVKTVAAHKAVGEGLRATLIRDIRPGSGEMSQAEMAVAAADLSSWRWIPVSSIWGTVIKVVPGIYAFIQFLRAFFIANH
jgi:hypothetical protein